MNYFCVNRVYMESDQGEKKAVTLDEIIDRVGKEYGLTKKEITAGGKQRGMIAYLVREKIGGLSLTDLGRRLKRDVSSLSAIAEGVLSRSGEDSDPEKRKHLFEKALF